MAAELVEGTVEFGEGSYKRFARVRQRDGADVALVLFHGSCAHSGQFSSLLEALSELNCSVAALDLLGCGNSPKPREWDSYGPDMLFDEAYAFFKEYSAKRTVVVGHSSGSALAMQCYHRFRREHAALLAAQLERGEKVAGTDEDVPALILMGTAYNLPPIRPPVFYLPVFILNWLQSTMTEGFLGAAFAPGADAALVEAERVACNANPMYMCKAYYRQFEWRMSLPSAGEEGGDGGDGESKDDAKETLPSVLIVQGKQDGVLPVAGARDLYAALQEVCPYVKLLEVDNAAHQVMQEQPEQVNGEVLDFLRTRVFERQST